MKRRYPGNTVARKPTYKRTKYVAKPMYQNLNRVGVANRETGYVDTVASPLTFATGTNSIYDLNLISQGTAVTQRVGKKIIWKSMQCRGLISTGSGVSKCAILIVYDKRPTGSLPNVTDVLNTSTASSFNNDANSGRFKILKRIDFKLNGGVGNDTNDFLADFYLNLRDLPVEFGAAGTGGVGDVELGSLYVITTGDGAGPTSQALSFRVRYLDV